MEEAFVLKLESVSSSEHNRHTVLRHIPTWSVGVSSSRIQVLSIVSAVDKIKHTIVPYSFRSEVQCSLPCHSWLAHLRPVFGTANHYSYS